MHTIAVLAMDGVIAFDLSTPIEVFTRTRLPDGRTPYRVVVCAPTPEVDAGPFVIRAHHGLSALLDADTIMLPGCADPTVPVPTEVLDALRQAAANGTRIASICSGAFTLAATGLLDGGRATPTGSRRHSWPRRTRRSTSTPTCSTWTTASSSPRPAPPRAWTCACT
jgi:transcriptional regulator GlxA family with amidase domain